MEKKNVAFLKLFKKIMLITLGILVISTAAFFIYAGSYYKAQEESVALMEAKNGMIEGKNHLALMATEEPADTGIIFYPGAKVEYIAYLPLLDQLRQRGITCILVKMPFNMAIFDKDVADDIQRKFPIISKWYIAGHSMGGAMASSYASDNPEKVQGLILLGAYIYGDYPPSNTLTIYGSYNTSVEEKVDYQENVVVIEGGNHAQFGDYGKQKNDPDADISAKEQRNQTVDAIMEFLDR